MLITKDGLRVLVRGGLLVLDRGGSHRVERWASVEALCERLRALGFTSAELATVDL